MQLNPPDIREDFCRNRQKWGKIWLNLLHIHKIFIYICYTVMMVANDVDRIIRLKRLFDEWRISMKLHHRLQKGIALLLLLSMLPLSACSEISPQDEADTTTQGTTVSKEPSQELPPQIQEDPALEISELMVFNTHGIVDSTGMHCGWIEIHNRKSDAVKLSDYRLEYNGRSFALPDQMLEGDAYVLLYANGKGEGVNASFTLGSSGTITLCKGEEIAHSLTYVNRNMDHSFVTATGGETNLPTPGYSEVKAADRLIISEIMSNSGVTPLGGQLLDYIELYNDGETPIDLSKLYLSEKEDKLYVNPMENKILEPGEYYLLVRDVNLPFGLSKDGGSLFVTRNDGVLIASATFAAMAGGEVWLHEQGITTTASPGYPNTAEGHYASICDRKGLVISEVIASNGSYSKLNKEYYDIVELWNNSDGEINLGDYYFSDSKNDLQKFRLPEITLGAGEYYTFHCTDTAKIAGTAHLNLSSLGEKVYLTKADGSFSDALNLPAMPYNVSYGRGDGAMYFFNTPTFGKVNGKGCLTVADVPAVNLAPGEYSGTQKVTLSGEGKIYYTLDGTRPTTSSALYKGEEFEITETTAIRTFCVQEGAIHSEVVTYNYLIDLPDYELPVLKISFNHDDLFGSSGIYTKYTSGREKECSAAFFVDGKEEFSINCGIKISGASSVKFDKKSFQLKFKAKYGTGKLRYKMFDNLDIAEFDSLVVRSGSQGMMNYRTHFNDELVTSLATESGNMPDLLAQAYRPCNLYLNGEYWGVYYIREKVDEDFISAHTGYSPESITMVQWITSLRIGESDLGWKELVKYATTHDLSKDEYYQKVADQICLESFVDMFVMRIWASDRDSGNMRAWQSTEGDGKWRFILFDCDISMENAGGQVSYMFVGAKQKETQKLVRAMMKNEDFRALMITRFNYHCGHTIAPETTAAKFDAMRDEIAHDMEYSIARWKNAKEPMHSSVSKWLTRVERIKGRLTTESYLESIRIQFVTELKLTPDEVRAVLGEEYVKYCG